MDSTAKRLDKEYTYGDYLTWPEDERGFKHRFERGFCVKIAKHKNLFPK
jgi:hypothetical protein